jgi:hypothetical protein
MSHRAAIISMLGCWDRPVCCCTLCVLLFDLLLLLPPLLHPTLVIAWHAACMGQAGSGWAGSPLM